MKSFDIQQVSTHVFKNQSGFELIVTVSRMVQTEQIRFAVEGDSLFVTKVTPLDCYYINTVFVPDRTIWESYDRVEAEHIPVILEEIKADFLNPKYTDL